MHGPKKRLCKPVGQLGVWKCSASEILAALGITAPTLIVHGDRDELYPVRLAVEMYEAIGGAQLWVVPNGGHGPIFGPLAAQFVSTAVTFLASDAQ